MTLIFTIATKSYLPLAWTLAESIKENGGIDNYKFIIIVVDGDESNELNKLENNIDCISAIKLFENNLDLYYSMAFRYDVTEFSTAIKPRCFLYFKEKFNCNKMLFFDPDIFIFNPLHLIKAELEKKNVLLTPHFLNISENILYPNRYLGSGAYNLGFLGININEKVINFLNWWSSRCEDMCYRERDEHLFTDQKWFDLITCFFPLNDLCILRDIGHNVAPWNLHERELIIENYLFEVKDLSSGIIFPLVFFHFSGFDYKSLEKPTNDKFDITESNEIKKLKQFYSSRLNNNKLSNYIKIKYSYDYFENGLYINKIHRRIYRKLELIGESKFKGNPFRSELGKVININEAISKDLMKKWKIDEIKYYNKTTRLILIISISVRIIIGWNNYIKLLKFLRNFSRFENQDFQINKEKDKNYKFL